MPPNTLAVRLGIALLIAAPVAGCGAGAPDDAEARAVVTRFIDQLRAGEIDAAWESTTADFKSDEGRESFRKYVKGKPVLAGPLEIAELKQVEIHGLTRWEAVLHPPSETKPPAIVRTMIAQEGDAWRVERLVVE
ncbi:MAG: hypothetical protein JNG89_06065 [Planctomycetaceae bacterium]|nr:hypothetical protein [Planctomycetaceae bacterium]